MMKSLVAKLFQLFLGYVYGSHVVSFRQALMKMRLDFSGHSPFPQV